VTTVKEFGEHGKLGHGETLFNDALHQLPLGFYWPGTVRTGASETPVELHRRPADRARPRGCREAAGLSMAGRSRRSSWGKAAVEPSRPAFAEPALRCPSRQERAASGDCLRFGLSASCEIQSPLGEERTTSI